MNPSLMSFSVLSRPMADNQKRMMTTMLKGSGIGLRNHLK